VVCPYGCTTHATYLLTCQHICTTNLAMKTETVQIRLSAAEKRSFEDAARIAGVSLSAWIRERLRRAARRDLEEAGHPIAFLTDVTLE
jgi:uncharacterized protein (DUF1778 family)